MIDARRQNQKPVKTASFSKGEIGGSGGRVMSNKDAILLPPVPPKKNKNGKSGKKKNKTDPVKVKKSVAFNNRISVSVITPHDEASADSDSSTIATTQPSKPMWLNQTESAEQQRDVSLNTRVKVRYVLHIKDYTAEEGQAAWYSREEIDAAVETRRKDLIEFVKTDSNKETTEQDKDDGEVCYWGLESSRTANGRKKKRAKQSRAAVLEALEDLPCWEGTDSDWEAIAKVYASACSKSWKAATARGADYSKIVLELQADTISALKRNIHGRAVRPATLTRQKATRVFPDEYEETEMELKAVTDTNAKLRNIDGRESRPDTLLRQNATRLFPLE